MSFASRKSFCPPLICYNDPLRIPSPIHIKHPHGRQGPNDMWKFPASTVVFLRGSLITSGEWIQKSWVSDVNCEVVHPWIWHSPGKAMGMIPFVGTVANMTYKTAGAAEKSLDPLGGFPGMMIFRCWLQGWKWYHHKIGTGASRNGWFSDATCGFLGDVTRIHESGWWRFHVWVVNMMPNEQWLEASANHCYFVSEKFRKSYISPHFR